MGRKPKSGDAADYRKTLIELASTAVEKRFKKKGGVAIETASDSLITPSLWVSTGSLALDRVCRGFNPGGIPVGPKRGRLVHIAGKWSTLKSLILDHLFKSVQELEGIAVCTESEGSRDPYFPDRIGLDLSEVKIMYPDTIESAFDAGLSFASTIRAVDKEIPIIWGVDSIEAMEAKKTADSGLSESGSFHYGGGRTQALGAAFRKVVGETNKHPTTVVLINQTRTNPMILFGDKSTTGGGNAPHFYASLEIFLNPSQKGKVFSPYRGSRLPKELRKKLGLKVTEKGHVAGFWVHARVNKSKVGGTLGRECDIYLDFQTGINPVAGLLEVLLEEGVVDFDGKKVVHHLPTAKKRTFSSQALWEEWILDNLEVLGPESVRRNGKRTKKKRRKED